MPMIFWRKGLWELVSIWWGHEDKSPVPRRCPHHTLLASELWATWTSALKLHTVAHITALGRRCKFKAHLGCVDRPVSQRQTDKTKQNISDDNRWQDSSGGKSAGCQAWPPEFSPQYPYGRRRGPIPTKCPLSCPCTLACMCLSLCTQNKWINNVLYVLYYVFLVHLCVHLMCSWCSERSEEAPRTEPRFSESAAGALNCWAVSLVPGNLFHVYECSVYIYVYTSCNAHRGQNRASDPWD